MDTATIGKVAGIVSAVGFVPYLIAILRGKAEPNRATWFIWSVMSLVLFFAYGTAGAKDTFWIPIAYLIGSVATWLASLRHGKGELGGFDRGCVVAALVILAIWLSLGPVFALAAALLNDFLGALPTIKGAFRKPEDEDRIAWGIWFVGNILNLFAVEVWTFEKGAYPIWMVIGSGIIAWLVVVPYRKSVDPEQKLTREMFAERINWSAIIWSFGILNVGAMLPQLVRLIQTRDTSGLSLETFVIYGVIQVAFAFDGFFKRNTVFTVCMGLSAVVSATIIGLILSYR